MPPTQPLKLNMCECGDLHLTYGSVTLHFSRKEFFHFASHMNRLATVVSRPPQPHHHTMTFTNPNGQSVH